MKTKMIAALVLAAAFATPALAEDGFYIVRDTTTKKCTIVDKKPTVTTMTVVNPDGSVYKSRAEAETSMKTVKVCTTE
jgi:hypothetical protein